MPLNREAYYPCIAIDGDASIQPLLGKRDKLHRLLDSAYAKICLKLQLLLQDYPLCRLIAAIDTAKKV